jgi:transcriptional regulator with PAS, ATPase and Fis domain
MQSTLISARRARAWDGRVQRSPGAPVRPDSVPFLVGESAAMRRTLALVKQVAATNSTVLITGETGVGKEVLARAIHYLSPLAEQVFLPVNCAAIPGPLLESQLFGHAKGAFTGAENAQPGLFSQAQGGTIFLDEIGELPPQLQVKLLRAIEKEILPVGSNKPVQVSVRIIASTNSNLRHAVDGGRFRDDLYYRLKVVHIDLPPLRDRREDIPPLVDYLIQRHNEQLERQYQGADADTLRALMSLEWRGNVRELDHVIEYAMIVGNGEWIRPEDLPPGTLPDRAESASAPVNLTDAVQSFERAYIEQTLRRNPSRRAAAKSLGIDLSTLYRKLQTLNIKLPV